MYNVGLFSNAYLSRHQFMYNIDLFSYLYQIMKLIDHIFDGTNVSENFSFYVLRNNSENLRIGGNEFSASLAWP